MNGTIAAIKGNNFWNGQLRSSSIPKPKLLPTRIEVELPKAELAGQPAKSLASDIPSSQTLAPLERQAVASAVEKGIPFNAELGGVKIGQSFSKLGTVVENPGLSILNFSKHGLNQAITRGVNPVTILNTVKNPVTVLQQSGGNYLYLTREAAVVINPAGRLVSTYPASMFDFSIKNILKGF